MSLKGQQSGMWNQKKVACKLPEELKEGEYREDLLDQISKRIAKKYMWTNESYILINNNNNREEKQDIKGLRTHDLDVKEPSYNKKNLAKLAAGVLII